MLTLAAAVLTWHLLLLSPDGTVVRKDFETKTACQVERHMILTVPIKFFEGKKVSHCKKDIQA